MNALNVLLFAGRFEVRGTSAYTLRLTEHLEDYEVTARVICPDSRLVDEHKRAQLPISDYRHLDTPLWGRVIGHVIRRDLADRVPDLIHVQSLNVLSQGTWLARRLQRPFVLTVHDSLLPRQRLQLDRIQGRQIIAVSESVQSELLKRKNLSEDMVTVIHSGVDIPENADSAPVLDPNHIPVIGTAGPLETVKGLPFFLGAAQQVLATRGNAEFLVSGTGPEESNLRRLAHELGISEHVTFVPNLHDFSKSLSALDIFCLPSLRQGLGTIMLEAMARGKPVIASGVGGIYSAVQDDETGLVVPPSNSSRLASRILELLNDPVRARAIGERARQFVKEQFGVEQMVEKTVNVYRRFAGVES